jgi:hypothetical protein
METALNRGVRQRLAAEIRHDVASVTEPAHYGNMAGWVGRGPPNFVKTSNSSGMRQREP